MTDRAADNAIYAKALDRYAAAHRQVFMLGEPAKLPIKKRDKYGKDAGWATNAFIGEEEMRISGVYASEKTGDIIATFTLVGDSFDSGIKHVEIKHERAKAILEGYSTYISNFENSLELKAIEEARAAIPALQPVIQPDVPTPDFYGMW